MRIAMFKALWGMEDDPATQLAKIASAGYDGFEAPLPTNPREFAQLARDHGLRYIGMAFPLEAEELSRALDAAQEANAEKLTVHAGKDYWRFDRGCAFFEGALRVCESSQIPVAFETHRGRLLFHPEVTAAYLDHFPELRLVADFSHWTVVCESMLEDQQAALDLACQKTTHLHARVGYEQGPQVPDPRAPEFARHVERFEQWWDAIRIARAAEGEEELTVDPEFGPPDYLHTEPFSQKPAADLWEVCLWMAERLRARWS